MVLVSLFLGIIITSMDLLREGSKEEAAMWTKIRLRQKEYNLTQSSIDNLLEIFEIIDVFRDGRLSVRLLHDIMLF